MLLKSLVLFSIPKNVIVAINPPLFIENNQYLPISTEFDP